jgi:hypothetical protein
MKTTLKLIALAAAAFSTAQAIPIINDNIGPDTAGTGLVLRSRLGEYYTSGFVSGLNGVKFGGQHVQLNEHFDGFFVRDYTAQPANYYAPMDFDLYLPYLPLWTGPQSRLPHITGKAFLLDAHGQRFGPAIPIVQYNDFGPTFSDVQVNLLLPSTLHTPADIYGIRYNLHLSETPGAHFSVAHTGQDTFFLGGNVFGIGPGKIPRDILVPDTGNTIVLLLCGLASCALGRRLL